jgi:filamentous hemagglutinin family protein
MTQGKRIFVKIALLAASGLFAHSAIAADALPTGGRLAAGAATINQSGNNLNVVQTSQRAVVNWDSFNVGANAKVEFIQPNAQAVIHNRVVSATASQIDGMVKANGQVIISNAHGVVFGKGSQVDAAAIVATTMDINDKDFMEGKSTFKGNGKGAVVNYGKLQTKDPKGYIALLAPEVRNEGYILAKGGVANTVALASGTQITLDFRGDQLMTVKVDASAYKSLIENKRLVQVDGGMVVIAANSAAQLMGSVIKNSGRISTSSMVNNGGVIEILADTVQNLGTIIANATGNTGNGGQINIKGNTIALTDTSKIKANAKGQGNGGQIIVLSEKKTQVSGILEAMGGKTSGNGGFIDTSSKEVLEISSKTKVDTSARNILGKAGTWLLDPMDLLITTGFAQVISDALQNNNVTVQVQGNVCSGGSCTQNGSGNLTIDQGVTISKTGGVKTVLTFLADGTFYNYGVINQAADSILEVVIQAQNVNLAQNSKIEVNKVTITAVNSVTGYGSIIGAGANPLVNILANIFNFHGAITVNSRAQVTVNSVAGNSTTSNTTVGTIRITADELTLASTGRLEANNTIGDGGTITLSANGTGIITIEGLIQTNGGNGRGGEINISQADDIHINNAIIQSNGNNGGYINIFTNSGDLILQNALIQTNGSNGRGGSIGISATNNTLISDSNIEAKGLNQGGIILIGNDADNGTLPFSISVTLDNANIDVSATNNLNNQDINQIKIDTQNDLLVNNSTLKANGEQGGQIYLNSKYQDIVFDNSVIQTNGSNGRGGTVEISSNSGSLTINSTIQATGATVGGTVLLTADHILLDSNTNIDVTGNTGGGAVLVGGDWQAGRNVTIRVFPNRDIHQSTTVTMKEDAIIDASAKINGDGGVVVLWSDITKSDSITDVKGIIRAMGGSQSGKGGKVETSGASLNFDGLAVDTRAADGTAGDWLLDPYDFFLNATALSTLDSNLANNNVTISTTNTTGTNSTVEYVSVGDGHIVFQAAFTYTGANARTLTLEANADIYIQGNISSTNGALSLAFNAPGDQVYLSGDIATRGGSVTFNAQDVHFQKISGAQSITTSNGNVAFGTSNIRLLQQSGTGTLEINTAAGELNLGSGSIQYTSTVWEVSSALIYDQWGGRTNQWSGVNGLVSYGINILAGRQYTARLYFWDSWDNEAGELHVRRSSDNNLDYYIQIYRTVNGSFSVSNTYSKGTTHFLSAQSAISVAHWGDTYADVTFTAVNSGTLTTWNNLNESAVDNESLELRSVRETNFSSNAGYTSGGRNLNLISTTGQILGSKAITGLAAVTVNTNNSSSSLSGVISGSGSLTKEGSGKLTLTANSAFGGGTTVNNGTLVLDEPAGGVAGTGVITGTLTVNANGIVQVTGSGDGLGWNTNRVSILNINSGLVEALGGTHYLWNATLNFNGGGTLRSNSGTSSSTATSIWEIGGTNVNVSNPSTQALIAGRLMLRDDLGAGTYTIADGVATNDLLVSAAITGYTSNPIGFIKAGAGTMTLTGNNTYTGGTTISAGILVVGGSGSLGSGSYAGNISIANTNSGAFQYASSALQTLSGVLSGAGAVTVSGSGALTLTGNNTYTGTTTVNSGSTFNLTPASPFTQDLSGNFVNNGTINYDGSNGNSAGISSPTNISNASGSGAWNITSSANPSLWNSRLVFSGSMTTSGLITVNNFGNLWIIGSTSSGINSTSAINLNGVDTDLRLYGINNAILKIGTLTGNGTVDFADGGGGKALTLSIGNDGGSGTFGGVISNSGSSSGPTVLSLQKLGAGTQTLSNANTYTGLTSINGGVISVAADANLGSNASLAFDAGTLTITGSTAFTSAKNITMNGAATITNNNSSGATFGGSITNSTHLLTLGGTGNTTLSGIIGSGSGSLTKTGAGTLTLSNANTYTGLTSINGGVISVAADANLGSNASLAFDAGTLTITGSTAFTSAKNITMNGAATITNNNSSGATFGGSITNSTHLLTLGGTGNTTLSGIIGSGSGSLTKTGAGTLTLSNTNTYTGGTTISGGVLKLGIVNAIPSNTILVESNGTLDLNGYSPTFDGLTGSGLVTSNSSGAISLTIGIDANTTNSTFSGTFSKGSATSLSLIKGGSGIFKWFSGANLSVSIPIELKKGELVLQAAQSIYINQNINATANSVTLVLCPGCATSSATTPSAYQPDINAANYVDYVIDFANRKSINLPGNSITFKAPTTTGTLSTFTVWNSSNPLSRSPSSSSNIILGSDIDLSGTTYTTAYFDLTFTGKFHGAGNVIRNLYISASQSNGYGLFKTIDSGASIRDVGVANFVVDINNASSAEIRVGAIAGQIAHSNTSNVYLYSVWSSGLIYARNNSTISEFSAGGLIGLQSGNIVRVWKSFSSISIDNQASSVSNRRLGVGGLFGNVIPTNVWDASSNSAQTTLTIKESYTTGSNNISSNWTYGWHGNGLFVGVAYSPTSISDSFSLGVIDGKNSASWGGIIGVDGGGGSVSRSYSFSGSYSTWGTSSVTSSTYANILPSGYNASLWNATPTYPVLDNLPTPIMPLYGKSVVTSGTYGSSGTSLANSSISVVTYLNGSSSSTASGTPVYSITNLTGAGTYTNNVYTSGLTLSGSHSNGFAYGLTSYLPTSFTVNKATLTYTAGAATSTYGSTPSVNSGSISGFVNSETSSALTGTMLFSTTATASSIVGSYAVNGSGYSSSNYNFIQDTVNATRLTISARPINITANANQTKVYGNSDPTFAYTVEAAVTNRGLVGSDTFSGTLTRASGENVGTTYAINIGTLANSNYSINYTSANFSITARPINITANASQTKVYGETNPTYGYASEASSSGRGLVSGDSFTGTLSRASGENVGNYAINIGTLANSNYNINFVSRDFAITRKAITLTAPTVTKAYDGLTSYTVTSANRSTIGSGLVAGDSITSAVITYDNKNVGASNKTVTLSDVVISDSNSGNNYTVILAGNSSSSITRQSSVTWIGGTTGQWFNPANWAVTGTSTAGAVPDLSNVSAVVIDTGKTVTFNDSVGGITSPASTGTVNITTITGGGSLTITNGALSGTSLSLTQLNTSVGTTVTASTGFTVAPATGTTDTIAGILAGGTFTKNGAGTTVLSAENTYTGATTATAGTIKLGGAGNGTNSPLGTVASGTVVETGAALDLAGFNLVTAEALTISGTGASSSGALFNSSAAAATYLGTITLAADATIKATGDLTINNTVDGAFALTVTNTGSMNFGSRVGSSVTRLASLTASGPVNLYGDVWTTGIQTYSGNLGIGGDLSLNSSSNNITVSGNVSNSAPILIYSTTNPSRKIDGTIDYVSGYGLGTSDAAARYVGSIRNVTYYMELVRGGVKYFAEVTFDAYSGITLGQLRLPDDSAASRDVTLQREVSNLKVFSNVQGSRATTLGAAEVVNGTNKTGYLEIWSYNYGGETKLLSPKTGNSSTYDFDDTPASPMVNGHGSFQVHSLTDRSTVLAWNMHRNAGPAEIGFGNQATGSPDWTSSTTNGTQIKAGTASWKLQVSINSATPNLTINSGTGTVNIGGTVAGLNALTVNTSATTNSTITGAIGNADLVNTTLTKQGTGTLVLNGANSYSGTTTVSAGTLKLGNPTALGTTTVGTTVASGAALDLNGQNISNAEALTISGDGISSGGALINTSSTGATYAGLVTLGANSSIIGETGTIALTHVGTITGTYGLTLGGAQGGSITSIVGISTGSLTKVGAGTWTMSGLNTYSGGTNINAGVLKAGSARAFGANSSAITVADGAVLDLNGTTLTNTNALTLNGMGISTSGALTNSSGTIGVYAGSITLGSTSAIGGTGGTVSVTGAIDATSSNFGLVFIGNKAISLSNTTNALRTIASGSSIGALTIVNTGNLTIGSISVGGTAYNGLNAGGAINIRTTGNLTISKDVITTSQSKSASAPALLLAAGSDTAAGTTTNNILLENSPTFTVGAGGAANFYTGGLAESADIKSYVEAQTNKTAAYNSTLSSTEPTTAGYNIVFRGFPPYIYVTIVDNQTSTYGTASGLSFWYSTSKTLYGSSYIPTLLPTLTSVQTFTAGAGTMSVNIAGITGSIAINTTLSSTLNADTYSLVLNPTLALSGAPGVSFLAGDAKNFVVNRKAVTLSATKTYDRSTDLTGYVTVGTGVGSQTLTYNGATANNANVATDNKFINAITLANATDGSGGLASNYVLPTLNPANAPVTITTRPVDVTANASQTKVYGETNPTYGYASEASSSGRGLVSGDSFTGALSRATGENVGDYAINVGTLANSNYNINFVSRDFAITRKAITLTAPTVTKAYDGLLSYTVTSTDRTAIGSGLVSGNTISSVVITYADKNVGTGKEVTLSDVVISDGNSGNNYTVTLAGNSVSSITRQSSVTWIGDSTGQWFNPANWAVTGNLGVSGAVPDLSNVSAVVIGTGKTVTFNDSVAGITSPASTGTVNITTISGGGSLTVTNGALSGTSLSLTQLNTSAGTTLTASTGFTVAPATSTTDTIAGILAGGTFTKNGAGTTVLSAENTYTGATTVATGILQVGTDRNLGAVPSSTTAGSLVLNGGTLSVTDTFTLDAKRGIALGSSAGTINVADEKVLTYGGAIANAISATGAITKSGLGSLVLTGANTYTGLTTINAGTVVVERDTPTFTTSNYTGSGRLWVRSASTSFGSPYTFNAPISSLGSLTIGQTTNATAVTLSSNITLSGNLLVYGPTSLGANVTTGGTQEYTGNVTISATNASLSTTNSNISFGGNINGTTANTNSLYLSSGSGAIDVIGSVGNTTALNYFGLGGTGQYQAGSTTNFTYTGAVQTFTATSSGTYTLSVWGASGGSVTGYLAGNGGFASGNYTLTAGQTISIYVGGQGYSNTVGTAGTPGGWNGGGRGGNLYGGSGGGATDIRIGGTALANRVIVAGGGGGADSGGVGGFGGGLIGGSSTAGGYSPEATGGSQVAGGVGAYSGVYVGSSGSLGFGGNNGIYGSSYEHGGGGGGGYYGGGGGSPWNAGGGGSSYIGGVTSGSTIAGNATMVAPGGGTQTGQTGNGYARILMPDTTAFNAGSQTGAVTIGGVVKAANLQTASTNFALKIGQTVASGTSTIGANTTLNNTGGFFMGTAANAHNLSVTGSLTTNATGTTKLNGGVTTTTTQTYSGAVELTGDTSFTTTDAAVTFSSTVDGTTTNTESMTVAAGSGNVTLSGAVGGTTSLKNISITTGALTAAAIKADAAITVTNTAASTISGIISGDASFTKAGASTLTLSGVNTFTGTTSVNAGTLILANTSGTTIADSSAMTVASGATLDLRYSETLGSLAGAGTITAGNAGAKTLTVGGLNSDTIFSGVIQNGSGSLLLTKEGTGTFSLTGANTYTGATVINAGTLSFENNVPSVTSSGFSGSGTLVIKSVGTGFTNAYSFDEVTTNLGGLVIGKSGNTANVTIASATTVAGPITIYGADITINTALIASGTNTISLNASGNLTDGSSGYVSATNLLLTGGNVTLDNNTNNAVGTLAASGVSGLTYHDKDALTVGTIGATDGISASGVIKVTTYTGDLTVAKNIATTNTGSSAIILNAGTNTARGTSTGGNVIISGSPTPTITTGTNGRVVIYTGSVADSTGVTTYVGNASGNFRYNSKEGTSGFTTALGTSGKYAIYREAIAVTMNTGSATMTYGDNLSSISGTVNGLVNGDTPIYAINNRVNSTSGNIKVGTYSLVDGGMAALGYTVTATTGTLTVDQREVTISGFAVSNKDYDGTRTAVISNAGTVGGLVAGDSVTVASVTAQFNDKHAAQNKALTISGGTLTGTDSGNYYGTISGSTTATIAPKAVTLTAPNVSKTYDGGLTYITQAADLTALSTQLGVSGDTVTGITLAFTNKNAGTSNKTVTATGVAISDGNSGNNYTITYANSTASTINKATVGLLASKEYDGTTSLAGKVTITTGVGSETLTYSGAIANDRNVITADKYISNITLLDATDGSGGLATNYQLPTFNRANAPVTITTKALTITADARQTTYGTALVLGTTGFTQSGLEASVDSISGVTLKHGTNTTVPATQFAGTYTDEIVASAATGSGLSNYNISYMPNTLTVNKYVISINAPSVTKAYDGLTSYTASSTDLTTTGSGLLNGDSITSATITYANKNVSSGNKVVTLDAITLSDGNGGNNYTVTRNGNSSSTITRQDSVTWIGGSTGEWFNPANWAVTGNLGVAGAVPDLSNVSAVVIGSGKTVTFNDSVAGITSPASTGTVNITTLSGGGSLTVTNGDISATSLNVIQLNTSVGTSITTSTGITVAPATGTTDTIAGILAGNGTLTKNGSGTTILSGTNTYAGATTIAVGTLEIANAAALGATSAGTTVESGAQLSLNGGVSGIIFNAEPLVISGVGVSSAGALLNSAGDNTFAGNITLAAASTIANANSSALKLSGTINGAFDLTINSNNDVELTGVVGGTTALASLTTNATGRTLVGANISTTGAQTYNDEVVTAGDVTFTSTGTSSLVTITSGRSSEAYYATSSGIFQNGETPLRAFDGNINSKTYNTTGPGSDLLIDSGSNYIVKSLGLTTANDNSSRDPISYTLYGSNSPFVITGAGAFGSGNIASGGLPGQTLISSGALVPPATRKADYPSIGISNSSGYRYYRLVFNDLAGSNSMQISEVRLQSQVINPLTASITFAGNLSGNNNIGINSGGTITAGNISTSGQLSVTNGGAASITGVISNGTSALTLVKSGAGNLTLSGTNTFTGDTNITAGTLTLAGSLATTTNVAMTNAAVWDLQAAQTIASLTMASGNSITNTAGTSSLTVSGASTLANSITTSGNQTYADAVTLLANTTLAGSTINTVSTVDGGGNKSLTITGNADVDGNITGVTEPICFWYIKPRC